MMTTMMTMVMMKMVYDVGHGPDYIGDANVDDVVVDDDDDWPSLGSTV